MTSTFTRTSQRSNGGTGIVMSVGLLTLLVDAAPVHRPNKAKDTATRLACPDPSHSTGDGSPSRVSQRYLCDADPDHTSPQDALPGYSRGELAKVREVFPEPDAEGNVGDPELVLVDNDEATEAKVGDDVETGTIDFHVHQAWEIDAMCLPGDHALRFRPGKTKTKVRAKDLEVYAMLTETLARNPHLALVGSTRMNDTRKTYRLTVWGTQLIAQEIVLPSDLAERDVLEADVTDDQVDKLLAIVESAVEPFDEAVHSYDAAAALDALADRDRRQTTGAEIADEATGKEGRAEVIDMTSYLDQMLAASKAA